LVAFHDEDNGDAVGRDLFDSGDRNRKLQVAVGDMIKRMVDISTDPNNTQK